MLAELVEQSTDEAVRIKSPTIEPQGDDAEGDIIDALATGAADVSVVRADRLATAGAASLSVLQIPQDAGANGRVWTITMRGNIATVDQPNGPDCTWELAFHDSAVSLDMGALGNGACFGRMVGTYSREGDVVMFHFDAEREYDVAFDNAFFNGGMQKIG